MLRSGSDKWEVGGGWHIPHNWYHGGLSCSAMCDSENRLCRRRDGNRAHTFADHDCRECSVTDKEIRFAAGEDQLLGQERVSRGEQRPGTAQDGDAVDPRQVGIRRVALQFEVFAGAFRDRRAV